VPRAPGQPFARHLIFRDALCLSQSWGRVRAWHHSLGIAASFGDLQFMVDERADVAVFDVYAGRRTPAGLLPTLPVVDVGLELAELATGRSCAESPSFLHSPSGERNRMPLSLSRRWPRCSPWLYPRSGWRPCGELDSPLLLSSGTCETSSSERLS